MEFLDEENGTGLLRWLWANIANPAFESLYILCLSHTEPTQPIYVCDPT